MDTCLYTIKEGKAYDDKGNEIDIGLVSDGHHTFNELYERQYLLIIALMQAHPRLSWKSKKGENGSPLEGEFAVGMNLPVGQVTFYIPIKFWDITDVQEIPKALVFDRHNSKDITNRLRQFISI